MQVFDDPKAFQRACLEARRQGELGLVPTMGYLHEGHASLLSAAARHRTRALTIFVNPAQFGPSEDLSRYPRDLERDLALAEAHGVHLVLAPPPEAIYPPGFDTRVEPGALAEELEGAHRPGHFRGVATVVLKLFQLAQPTHAYFGRKDYQQLAIIRRMAVDFDLPLEVVPVETVRESDGLAKSSRNVYLSPDDRRRARCLWLGLEAAKAALATGETDAAKLESFARAEVERGADRIDYVAVRDRDSLRRIETVEHGRAVLLVAAVVGATRLIDNAEL
jgi:pantoate--beta-alanine ligase